MPPANGSFAATLWFRSLKLVLFGLLLGTIYPLVLYGNFPELVITGAATGIMAALAYCAFEFFLFAGYSGKRTLWKQVLVKGLAYGVMFSVLLLLLFYMDFLAWMKKAFGPENEMVYLPENWISSKRFYSICIYGFSAALLSQFIIQLIQMKGREEVLAFFGGKYVQPHFENMILLRIGFRNAEEIKAAGGRIVFRNLYNSCLKFLSDIPAYASAMQVKYEPDAVLIAWKQGKERNEEWLQLLMEFRQRVEANQVALKEETGCRPVLMSMAHAGNVLVSQTGTSPRELVLEGDTLNELYLMRQYEKQGHGQDIFISAALLELIPAVSKRMFTPEEIYRDDSGRQVCPLVYAMDAQEANDNYRYN